jgi:hypothetical protein
MTESNLVMLLQKGPNAIHYGGHGKFHSGKG